VIDWPAFIARVDLTRYPLPMRMRYIGGAVVWSFLVTDHRDGARRWLDTIPVPVPHGVIDERGAMRWVRYWTQVTALHELDECIYLDGRRPFDPHQVVPLPRWDT
jgi:hypothetical protein